MATTAQTLINSALRKNGKTNPDNTILENALEDLNNMLSFWSVEGLLIPNVTKESFAVASALGSRTIGSSGNFNTVRPVKIVDAYIQDSGGNDYPVKVDMTLQEYNNIVDKTVTGRPTQLYYHPAYPLGIIYFDYVTDAAYTLYLDSLKQITEFASLSTSYSMPPEYKLALIYNLAVFISHDFDQQLSPDIFQIAAIAKSAIIANNLQIKTLSGDSALLRKCVTNILTGE